MMKNSKFIIVTLIVLTIVGGMFIYVRGADGFDNESVYTEQSEIYRKEMNEIRRNELNTEYENGKVTENEKDMWLEHYDDIDRFEESGRSYGRGCHGGSYRKSINMNENRNRHNKMMGGYRY